RQEVPLEDRPQGRPLRLVCRRHGDPVPQLRRQAALRRVGARVPRLRRLGGRRLVRQPVDQEGRLTRAAALVLLAGCFNPDLGSTPFKCGNGGEGPPGYDCALDGLCREGPGAHARPRPPAPRALPPAPARRTRACRPPPPAPPAPTPAARPTPAPTSCRWRSATSAPRRGPPR